MKCYFPVHINGGNRGCEGIAKGTAQILNEPRENLIGLCTDPVIDEKLGVGSCVVLSTPRKPTIWFRVVNRLYVYAKKLLKRDAYSQSLLSFKYTYGRFIKQMSSDDILVSTGGDMMCYADNFAIYTALEAKRRGCKTVLWGCSMGSQNLTRRKEVALRSFDLIYARETLSRDFFLSLGLKHVICYPDPAFALEPIPTALPPCFLSGRVIGVNLSNLTIGAFHFDTPFGNEVRKLFDYILEKTNFQILLIPHVTWQGQDDRLLAQNVLDEYKNISKNRMSILDIEGLNYLQIRYVISNCYLFIGGRTHAVISAYSTCTPAIALGYSIKSKGIAHDLGLSEYLVVDTKKQDRNDELLSAFKKAVETQAELKAHLMQVMPSYRQKTEEIKKELLQWGR